ncbi:MAG: VIT domain-containing protein, partial [Saprospiraceae bacterium]
MKWIFLPLFLLAFQFLTAQNDLYVNNPQEGWHFEQGFIDEAELHIKPKGIYMEYGLYLTMSIPEDYFDPSSQLEIVMNFTLPEEAHIIDSWLWVEEDIVRADIIDRWTANQIYEDIVDRRQDPSILFKNGQGQYQLRIYPLFSDGSRKVKITYLMPTRWEDGKVQVDLPNELLRTSVIPPDLRVRTFLPTGWSAPKLLSDRTESFVTASDPVFGTFQETVVNQEIVWEENLVFEVESP